MPTVPSQFRLTKAELDLIDALRVALRPEPGIEVTRTAVVRAGVKMLAEKYGPMLPKNNARKKIRPGSTAGWTG